MELQKFLRGEKGHSPGVVSGSCGHAQSVMGQVLGGLSLATVAFPVATVATAGSEAKVSDAFRIPEGS